MVYTPPAAVTSQKPCSKQVLHSANKAPSQVTMLCCVLLLSVGSPLLTGRVGKEAAGSPGVEATGGPALQMCHLPIQIQDRMATARGATSLVSPVEA